MSGETRLTAIRLPRATWEFVEDERQARAKIGHTPMTLDAYVSQTVEAYIASQRDQFAVDPDDPRSLVKRVRLRLPVGLWDSYLTQAFELQLGMGQERERRHGQPWSPGGDEDEELERVVRARLGAERRGAWPSARPPEGTAEAAASIPPARVPRPRRRRRCSGTTRRRGSR